jgi:hypothetical protein
MSNQGLRLNRRLIWLVLAGLIVSAAALGVRPVSSTPAIAAGRVQVRKETLTLRSYDWRSALVPTAADDPIYPYPRLNFDKVGPASDITTTVIILESAGTRLTIAPEYGGRILRWFDKKKQREVLYANPVIKPTRWGYRGWWLATGGIEWAFPTNEHGLNEWRPWRYQTYSGSGYAGVTVSDRDDRTGLDVSVTVALYANEQIAIIPRISNRTRSTQTFQFWINAMLPYSPDLKFDLPATQVEIHSTGDESLPEPGQKIDWPIFNGRDFSKASEWHQYLGVFAAPATQGHASVRNPATNARVMRTFPVSVARGVKLFLLGDLPSDLYTDGDSRYLEMWGGYTRTFDENATLKPGRSVTWIEYWSAR